MTAVAKNLFQVTVNDCKGYPQLYSYIGYCVYLSSIPGRCNFVLTTFTAPVSLSDGPFFDYRYVGGLIEVFLWGWDSNMNKGCNFFPNAVYLLRHPTMLGAVF